MGLKRLFVTETFGVFSENNGKYEYLEDTLMTYMKLNRASTKTANELNIHLNTLYQRLEKIENLLSIDLNNSEDVLNVQLVSYLKETESI